MRRFGTGLRCAVYVAVLLGIAMGADRVLSQRLYEHPEHLVPAYRSFNERSVGVKLHQLESSDTRFDTLVIGNSRTLFAVQPATFDRRVARSGLRRTSFNLAMPTVDVRFWPRFFERYYDRAPPRHVLLGLIPRDLDVRNRVAAEQARAFEASPGFVNRDRTWVWKDAEEALADLFRLRGRGNELRSAGPRKVLRGEKLDRRDFGLDGDRGWAAYDPALAPPKDFLAAQAAKLGDRTGEIRLRVGRDQLDALAELDRIVRAAGGCLTIFTTPVLYDREPLGTVEVRRDFELVLRDFVARNPTVGLADLGPRVESRYSLADYGDGDHLAPSGAQRFSRELADAVTPRLGTGDCRDPIAVDQARAGP